MEIRLRANRHAAAWPRWVMVLVAACLASAIAQAQSVYRCETNGRVGYSHEPFVGAKVVDTTPTQGLDKSTGVSLKVRDVQREELNRSFNEVVRCAASFTGWAPTSGTPVIRTPDSSANNNEGIKN